MNTDVIIHCLKDTTAIDCLACPQFAERKGSITSCRMKRFDEAREIIEKYQKIEQIVSEWNNHCISTQVAISEIANEVLECDICGMEYYVVTQPTVEQEPRWIPISEKWPEDCQEVLVTTDEGNMVTDVFHADSGGCYFEERDIEYVKAWMPLPQPYKAESEET